MKEKWNWFFLGFGGLVLGVFLTLAALYFSPKLQQKIARSSPASRQLQVWDDFSQPQRQMIEHFDRLFRDGFEEGFFRGQDPFKHFKAFNLDVTGGNGVGELSQREDDRFVYYDLEVEDLKSTSIQSKIENGYLTVSGVVEKKNRDEGFEKTVKSEFHRTLPLPQNIDTQKMEVVSEGHRVTFKFPKV